LDASRDFAQKELFVKYVQKIVSSEMLATKSSEIQLQRFFFTEETSLGLGLYSIPSAVLTLFPT
jgi:hypothetical protein